LLVCCLLVCVAELVVGWMLWRNRRPGLVFALALVPIEFLFWVGFLLPVGPPLGLIRTVLVLMTLSRERLGSAA
jgi:TRAP-type C4-dicarboxylate transport system permease small subunit